MSRLAKYLPALAILGAVTIVSAQGADPAPAPASPPPASVNRKLTAAEMSESIIVSEQQIQADGRQMMHLKDVASRQKDVIKLTCLNDKLIQYKAQVNIWDSGKVTFQSAATKSDADRETAYASLMGTANAVRELRDQSNACVGEPELYKQEAGVEVNHPAFPDDPTADDPFDPTVTDIEPPAYASPYY
jgi:hypothetical protein